MAGSLWRRLTCKTYFARINNSGVRALTNNNNCFRIVASDDGETIVCWHPEVEFPYEKSLPIKLDKKETNTALNVQNIKEIASVYQTKKPEFMKEELMQMTYTTKHRWVPEGIHKRRRKRNFDENRPYL